MQEVEINGKIYIPMGDGLSDGWCEKCSLNLFGTYPNGCDDECYTYDCDYLKLKEG